MTFLCKYYKSICIFIFINKCSSKHFFWRRSLKQCLRLFRGRKAVLFYTRAPLVAHWNLAEIQFWCFVYYCRTSSIFSSFCSSRYLSTAHHFLLHVFLTFLRICAYVLLHFHSLLLSRCFSIPRRILNRMKTTSWDTMHKS